MTEQSFEERLTSTLAGLPIAGERRYALAFSGGLDSTVLLAALCRIGLAGSVRALHIDHGLHADSAAWGRHCRAAAEALGVDYGSVRVEVKVSPGASFEAPAREARYRALAEQMTPGEVLLTAHHADDQLETVLLRLLRGAGVRGLRGIAAFVPFAPGYLARPLLGCSRAELRACAQHWQLRWLEDPSNQDPRYDRSYLRLQVLPRLLERWPAAPRLAARLARRMADAEKVLTAMAEHDACGLDDLGRVPRPRLLDLPEERQRNLLRYLIGRAALPLPNARRLEELRAALLVGQPDARTRVQWAGGEARVYRDRLYLLAPVAPAPGAAYRAHVDRGQPWRGSVGSVALLPGGEACLPESWLRAGLQIRFRAGGERFRPWGAPRSRPLKRWLAEAGVVPWMRDRVPLLYRQEQLVAVADLWVCDAAREAPVEEARWRVAWTERPAIR